MKILISVWDRLYKLDLSNLKDVDDFLDYYHTHELFPVKGSAVYASKTCIESITYIPKHAITAIYIELEDKK